MSFEISFVGHKSMASRVVRHSKPNPPPNEHVKVYYLCGKKDEYMTKYSNWKNEEKVLNIAILCHLQIVTFVKTIIWRLNDIIPPQNMDNTTNLKK